jgi:nitroreductase
MVSPVTPFSLPEFEKLVDERRSVRLFDGSPMPEAITQKIIDLALLAPNSSNLQPWEFHWVKNEPMRGDLVKYCLSQAAAATAAELIVCVARRDTWQRARADMIEQMTAKEKEGARIPQAAWQYYRKLVPLMYVQGPLSILGHFKALMFFITGFKKPVMREPANHTDMRIWAIKSTALACQNMMLAARAYGYDSCPMEGIDSRRIRKMLKLPRSSDIVMVLGFGKRSPKGVTLPRIRANRALHVFKH